MNQLHPPTLHDPRRHLSATSRTQHGTYQIDSVNRVVTNCDSAVRIKASPVVMDFSDRPTVPAKASIEELVLCAVEARAIDFGGASVAVKTGLLTAEQLLLAEARFFDRYGYQHFAAQMRRTA